jgi:hypothetical protein
MGYYDALTAKWATLTGTNGYMSPISQGDPDAAGLS